MTTLEEFGVECPEPADQRSELERRRDQMTQCTATKGDGEQCQNKARGEHEQCGIHRPADEDNRCIAYTDDGDRCRNAQGYDSDYCHLHEERLSGGGRCHAIAVSTDEQCRNT